MLRRRWSLGRGFGASGVHLGPPGGLGCCPFWGGGSVVVNLGDNCIQNFHLGRYIVGYMVGNWVLRRRVSGVVKCDFRRYIRQYTSPNENFEYGYAHSNALLTFSLQKDSEIVLCCTYTSSDDSCIKPLASCIYSLVNQWKATLRNDVRFPTVYCRTYCRKFMTLSNQT